MPNCCDLSVTDYIIMLQRSCCHRDSSDSTVRIMFFDISSTFNTVQLGLLGEKMQLASELDHGLSDTVCLLEEQHLEQAPV